ncbi:MAG: 4-(cytidine 5'-diphospho)-2-C-methyl-D-erythritol kinase [Blastomonas sp.]
MPEILSEIGFAKINLALHVRERLANGYHRLETVFAFVDDGDRLTVEAGAEGAIECTVYGRFADELARQGSASDNLVVRAALALQTECGTRQGACFRLEKRLPVASGIGGGSADAAAALRLLNRLWRLDWPLDRLAQVGLSLGADIPACVFSQTMRGEGIGENLSPWPDSGLAGRPVLLVNPLRPISTASVFAAWDGVDRGGMTSSPDAIGAARAGRNDLQPMAEQMVPEITEILGLLENCNPELARMSGSGATCFALFETLDDVMAAQESIEAHLPGAWTMAGRLRA